MSQTTEPRMPGPLIHVIALALMTTATNASAIAPRTFGGAGTTIVLATITVVLASLESLIARRTRARVFTGHATVRDQDVLTLQVWGCALATVVSVVCVLTTVLL